MIESVLFHPGVLEHISEDDANHRNLPEGLYLGGFVDGVCVGVLIVIPVSRWCADVHVHVLPEHRKQHSEMFGKNVVSWVWDNTTLNKMTAQIPFCCENVKRFAERMGFGVEGVNRQSWRKHGQFWDSWYLGMVRQ